MFRAALPAPSRAQELQDLRWAPRYWKKDSCFDSGLRRLSDHWFHKLKGSKKGGDSALTAEALLLTLSQEG